MEQKGEQDVRELWFPGVHCDIGGGYPEAEGGLWRIPFQWILDEARVAGLLVDQQRLDHVLHKTQVASQTRNVEDPFFVQTILDPIVDTMDRRERERPREAWTFTPPQSRRAMP